MTSLPASDPSEAANPSRSATPRADLIKVVLWMLGALLSFSVLAVAVRTLADRLNLFEILSIRSGAGFLICLGALAIRPDLRHGLVPRRLGIHLVRNSIHFAAQYGWALSLTLLPLATVFAIEFTAPAWTALLATLLLGERMTKSRAGSIALGFLGVLVVLRPGLGDFNPATLLVLVVAFGFSIVFITTKKLTADVPTFAILFWMNAIQLPMGLVGSDPLFLLRIDAWQIPAVIGIGIAGTASHLCLSNAFRSGDATIVAPLDFLRIPLIALVGWTFYNEALDIFVFAGAGLIVSGVLWNLWAEKKR